MPDKDRRLIRFGDHFSSDDLDSDDIELELPAPSPEPAEEDQTEPWGSPEKEHLFHSRVRLYRERFRNHSGD
jgi:hypothetical protein